MRICKPALFPLILLVMLPFLSSCGAKLGEIRLEDVNSSISDAQRAIEEARRLGAEEYAKDQLMRAEALLAQAQEALTRKDGLRAMDLAYKAMAEAKAAGIASWRIQKRKEETESLLKDKEAELERLRQQLEQAQRQVENARSEMANLSERVSRLEEEKRRELEEARQAQREAEKEVEKAYREIDRLQAQLDSLRDRLDEARLAQHRSQREAELLIKRLSSQMEQTKSQLERVKREAEAARERARSQAAAYSRRIGKIEREKARELAIAQAREYVARQQAEEARSYPPPLSQEEIQEARSFVESWYLDWANGNIAQHLLRYAPNAKFTKVLIKGGRESKTDLSRSRFESELRRQAERGWKLAEKSFSERALVGRYTLSRETKASGEGGVIKLVDVWVREAYARKLSSGWKITREIWRFYESVPDYATRR